MDKSAGLEEGAFDSGRILYMKDYLRYGILYSLLVDLSSVSWLSCKKKLCLSDGVYICGVSLLVIWVSYMGGVQ